MLDLDLEFHRLLLDAADNPLLKERADFIYIIVEFQLVNPRFQAGRGRLGLSQHLDILDAILAGDLPAAERHLVYHLQSAEETLRGVAKTRD
jgi:DNA-binding FadR family transcriptional regulator